MQSRSTYKFDNLLSRTKWEIIRILTPIVMNFDLSIADFITQACFLVGLVGIASIGIIFAIPYLYSNYSENTQFYLRLFGVFLVFQLIINWLCVKFADSSYRPRRDGIMPDGLSIGQSICRTNPDHNGNGYGNLRPARKDASSVSMTQDERGESVVYVATTVPKSAEAAPERQPYPYLSWVPCVRCNRPRPPRCHHCPVCNKCVLKRDHHCFFTGVCIGSRNMRHFTVFVFWALMGALFASVHAIPFYYHDILPYTSYFDLIFPVAVTRAFFGYIDWMYACCIMFGWLLLVFLLIANTYMRIVVDCISSGKTSFEIDNNIKIIDTRGKKEKIAAVFGQKWRLNFLFPLHMIYEPMENPVNWPTVEYE